MNDTPTQGQNPTNINEMKEKEYPGGLDSVHEMGKDASRIKDAQKQERMGQMTPEATEKRKNLLEALSEEEADLLAKAFFSEYDSMSDLYPEVAASLAEKLKGMVIG